MKLIDITQSTTYPYSKIIHWCLIGARNASTKYLHKEKAGLWAAVAHHIHTESLAYTGDFENVLGAHGNPQWFPNGRPC